MVNKWSGECISGQSEKSSIFRAALADWNPKGSLQRKYSLWEGRQYRLGQGSLVLNMHVGTNYFKMWKEIALKI